MSLVKQVFKHNQNCYNVMENKEGKDSTFIQRSTCTIPEVSQMFMEHPEMESQQSSSVVS